MKQMKKIFLILLALFLLLTSCATPSETNTMTAEDSTSTALTEEETTRLDYMPKKLTVDQVTSLPVANEEMTGDELRELVVNYFELQLSFQWIPDMDLLDYPTTYASFADGKTIDADGIYGGIPYQSTGTGNLYRWLEYYDEETGVMNLEKAFAENGGYGEGAAVTDVEKDEAGNVTYQKYRSMMTLFNQCSVASFWGWGRVINSASFSWTQDMNVYNGFIPVGCYDYGYEHNGKYYGPAQIKRLNVKDTSSNDFGNPKGYGQKRIISDWKEKTGKGKDAWYEIYALVKPGDCLVQPGHVMMVKSVQFFTRDDGTISLPLSEVTVIEQIEGWGEKSVLGKQYNFKNQGGVNRVYTFSDLLTKNYIPFTFAEFLDPDDPQDKKHLDYYNSYADILSPVARRYTNFTFTQEELEEMSGIGVEKAKVFTTLSDEKAESISMEELENLKIASNYPISDLFYTVYDKDGKEILKNVYRATSAEVREVSSQSRKSTWEKDENGNYLTVTDQISKLTEGENKIKITLQVSTGELLSVYEGMLIP